MSGSKRTGRPPKEWAKHLRSFGKKEFWSLVRNIFRSEEKEDLLKEIDKEELKRNKEEYERELRASLNAEDLVNEITGDPGHVFPDKPTIINIDFGSEVPVKDQDGNTLFHTDKILIKKMKE